MYVALSFANISKSSSVNSVQYLKDEKNRKNKLQIAKKKKVLHREMENVTTKQQRIVKSIETCIKRQTEWQSRPRKNRSSHYWHLSGGTNFQPMSKNKMHALVCSYC